MTFHTQPDETILLQLRKHWFVFFKLSIGIVCAGVIPLLVVFLLSLSDSFSLSQIAPPAVWTFAGALWLLVIWMALATVWTNYYLDIWIVTDKRIVYVEQIALFRRKVVTLRMERIQDVTDEMHGVLETLLGFGTLRIQTAGPMGEYTVIEGIPDPERVRNRILTQIDAYTDRLQETDDRQSDRLDS